MEKGLLRTGKLEDWLAATEEYCGIDLDSYTYEWRKLMILFNANYIGIKELEEKNGGYHIILNCPSSFDLRRCLGDDKKRIKSG